ncbi:hypothetical protein IFM89_039522 [Coptis chinensis]|uniref:Uncharacterized protein n=1 Tax=Coptis chinensis TaxID=261450 RepID=A0A835LAK2_9MAGN|nr:hypothetical protein IFM89_039522 [Coptis chinensis]
MAEQQVTDPTVVSKLLETPPQVSASVATTSAVVPSVEKKRKETKKKEGKKEDVQKKETKKKEDLHDDKLKKSKNKKNEMKKKKEKGESSSSSSSESNSSESDEHIQDNKKAKTAETWIWWGILGGLLLVIGGALKIVKASKIEQSEVKFITCVKLFPSVFMASLQMQKPDEQLNLQTNQVDKPAQEDTHILHNVVNTNDGNLNIASDKKKKDKKEKKEKKDEKKPKDKDLTKDKKEKKKNKDVDSVHDKKKQEKENKHEKEKKKHK